MARDIQNKKSDGKDRMDVAEDTGLSARLARLDTQLSNSRRLHEEHSLLESDDEKMTSLRASGLALGFRLSSEFVAAVVVGAAIGWSIDYFLPTSPWGLIAFVLVGFAAGLSRLIKDARAASG
ncbi:MAG TPA: AtpZ/AtpI family protein [Nitrobacter sp.]|nr:AtpZ/AtpI family protein [Nitrobacter sp.]